MPVRDENRTVFPGRATLVKMCKLWRIGLIRAFGNPLPLANLIESARRRRSCQLWSETPEQVDLTRYLLRSMKPE